MTKSLRCAIWSEYEGAFRRWLAVVRRRACGLPGSREAETSGNAIVHALYTRWVVPLLGRVIAGDSDAYTYLPSSMGNTHRHLS